MYLNTETHVKTWLDFFIHFLYKNYVMWFRFCITRLNSHFSFWNKKRIWMHKRNSPSVARTSTCDSTDLKATENFPSLCYQQRSIWLLRDPVPIHGIKLTNFFLYCYLLHCYKYQIAEWNSSISSLLHYYYLWIDSN